MTDSMRILVDVTTWVPGRTGIGLYTERLLRAWQELGTGDELLLASNTPPVDLRAMVGRKLGPRFPIRAVWLQTAVPLQIARCKPEFAFFPNYIAPIIPTVPYVITVHDLAIFLYPETFTFKKRVLQRALLPLLVRQAAAVLTPSENTRRDLLRLLPTDPRKVVAVPLAAADHFSLSLDPVTIIAERAALQLPAKYLLAVGTLEPRKNLVRLLVAFAKIAGQIPDVHLVVAGGRGWRDDAIAAALHQHPAKQQIHAVGYVGPAALRVLYAEALALCYPSLYEGFGLPVVEAMASGTPVMTSKGSSLDEVAAGAAIAVDPLSVDEMARAMLDLAQSTDLRAELRAKGLRRAAELSWAQTARASREVFVNLRHGKWANGAPK